MNNSIQSEGVLLYVVNAITRPSNTNTNERLSATLIPIGEQSKTPP